MATIREVIKHGKTRYEIDLGRIAGKRKRRFTKTLSEAKSRLKEIEADQKALGDAWSDLDSRQKQSILETLNEIKDHGLTIEGVWKAYRDSHLFASQITLESAVREFLEAKKDTGWRERYAAEMVRTMNRFTGDRKNIPIATLTHEDIRSWIKEFKSDSTRKTMQGRLSILFAWAERQGYVASNPMKRVENIRLDQSDPEILSVAECRRLIKAARDLDPDMLPYFALSLFLGIRPEECMRIKPDAIDLDRMTVTISGETSKTRNRRVITIIDPAYRIFKEMSPDADWKTNFRRRRTAIRKAAKIKHWPKDVLRHTAASHFYNIYGMDEATKQLGHSAAIMLRHYRQLVSKEETEDWLAY